MEEADTLEKILSNYRERLVEGLNGFDFSELMPLVQSLQRVRAQGRTVFTAGNGGSASTAQHMATDLGLGTNLTQPPLRVVSLSESTSAITATGNDIDYSQIFSRQLGALGVSGDLLILISASGNSPNLINAASVAKSQGIQVAAVTGFDGGELALISDVSIHVQTEVGDYGVAEDIHSAISHALKEAMTQSA